jgi:hypothetical protein
MQPVCGRTGSCLFLSFSPLRWHNSCDYFPCCRPLLQRDEWGRFVGDRPPFHSWVGATRDRIARVAFFGSEFSGAPGHFGPVPYGGYCFEWRGSVEAHRVSAIQRSKLQNIEFRRSYWMINNITKPGPSSFNAVGFNFVIEGLASDTEPLGGFEFVAASFLQHVHDRIALDTFQQGEIGVLRLITGASGFGD